MNKKLASEIALGVIILVALVFGGIFWMKNKKIEKALEPNISNQQIAPAVKIQKETTPVVVDETENWQVYTNVKYGFEIKLGSAWKNYGVVESKNNTEVATLRFQLQTNDPAWVKSGNSTFEPLQILIYTPKEWAAISKQVIVPNFIAKNDKYVFAFTGLQDIPVDFGSSNQEAIKILEFNKVISTFIFLN